MKVRQFAQSKLRCHRNARLSSTGDCLLNRFVWVGLKIMMSLQMAVGSEKLADGGIGLPLPKAHRVPIQNPVTLTAIARPKQ